MKKIKNVLLIPNTSKEIRTEKLGEICSTLSGVGCDISVTEEYAGEFGVPDKCRITPCDKLSELDAAVVLGGDGSIIRASHMLAEYGVPIIGINYGHVGYLTELEIAETEKLRALAEGEYTIDSRMMLDAFIRAESGEITKSFTVLNDIVLTNGPLARLISFSLYCDGIRIEDCRADGIIASTPTGSTAYSLSAGGPVVDPGLDGICITPICPHTLSSRPAIFRSGSVIEIKNIKHNETEVFISADGYGLVSADDGGSVEIHKSEKRTNLIRLGKSTFLDVLYSKLK